MTGSPVLVIAASATKWNQTRPSTRSPKRACRPNGASRSRLPTLTPDPTVPFSLTEPTIPGIDTCGGLRPPHTPRTKHPAGSAPRIPPKPNTLRAPPPAYPPNQTPCGLRPPHSPQTKHPAGSAPRIPPKPNIHGLGEIAALKFVIQQ